MSIQPYTKRKTTLRLKHVRIRLIDQSENEEWNALLEKHHYLSNGNMVGPQLRYVAEIGGKTVGLIGFSNASLHLSARDNWIGWNDVQRDRRLGFVVQNSRFLILPDAHRKNMASKILSLCAKRIGDDWERLFHHPVLILETFTGLDKKRRGTGYMAAGWERVGETKGYTRDRRNFYTKSGIGKGVWCKELCPNARNILSKVELPEKYAEFEKKVTSDFARRKLGAGTLDSLREVLRTFDDLPRKSGQRYLTSSCLAVLFCGIFAGCKGVRECCDFVSSFSQPQLRSLRMWRDPATKRYKAPSYVTVWRAIARTDPMEFERRILSWFNKEMGGGVRLVHIDGKSIRATMDEKQNGLHVVSAASFDDFFLRQTVVENKNHEDEAARNILADIGEMQGTTFTFDALHTKGDATIQVVECNKADYFAIVKNNTRALRRKAESLTGKKVQYTAESFDNGHGRIERRKLELTCVTPQQMEYPHCHACGKITRVREIVRDGKVVGISSDKEYFVASHKNAGILGAEFFLHAAREHWAIENKLHHVKDRSMDEDRINIRGGYARIKTGIQSLAALTISASKDSANCVQRRISSNKKSLIALMTCKSLSAWRLAFL